MRNMRKAWDIVEREKIYDKSPFGFKDLFIRAYYDLRHKFWGSAIPEKYQSRCPEKTYAAQFASLSDLTPPAKPKPQKAEKPESGSPETNAPPEIR